MDRVILHSDANCFYAACEIKYRPELRDVPMVVGGDEEARHGIVLAANYPAKRKYGIKTAETLFSARRKCPHLICVPARYELYMDHSNMLRELYEEYTDQVESFGFDECWLDVTHSKHLFGDGEHIADEIRGRVKKEIGLAVSIGVSFNKIFAKLGSDMNKPDATTLITRDNYKEKVWPLPASDLLNVGASTQKDLSGIGVYTIGQIAQMPIKYLTAVLGVNGYAIWTFANGDDKSRVGTRESTHTVKTVGNSRTTPYDLITDDSIKITLYQMSESVAARLREAGYICGTVQINIRGKDLSAYQRQGPMPYPCQDSNAIFQTAFDLYKQNRSPSPIRNIGVRASGLSRDGIIQLAFIEEVVSLQKHEDAERAIDKIRERFGFHAVRRGLMHLDKKLSKLNPKDDHITHPVSYFR